MGRGCVELRQRVVASLDVKLAELKQKINSLQRISATGAGPTIFISWSHEGGKKSLNIFVIFQQKYLNFFLSDRKKEVFCLFLSSFLPFPRPSHLGDISFFLLLSTLFPVLLPSFSFRALLFPVSLPLILSTLYSNLPFPSFPFHSTLFPCFPPFYALPF